MSLKKALFKNMTNPYETFNFANFLLKEVYMESKNKAKKWCKTRLFYPNFLFSTYIIYIKYNKKQATRLNSKSTAKAIGIFEHTNLDKDLNP